MHDPVRPERVDQNANSVVWPRILPQKAHRGDGMPGLRCTPLPPRLAENNSPRGELHYRTRISLKIESALFKLIGIQKLHQLNSVQVVEHPPGALFSAVENYKR